MAKSRDETGTQRILKKEKQRRNSDRQKEILKYKGNLLILSIKVLSKYTFPRK